MLTADVQSLDFGSLKVIFGARYIHRPVRYVQNPYSGQHNRKAFAREYGKNGELFIKAVSYLTLISRAKLFSIRQLYIASSI